MKKIALFLLGCTLIFSVRASFASINHEFERASEIFEVSISDIYGYQKIEDVAQYKNADWNNVICIARDVSLGKACQIANQNPDITYFFYTKGRELVLETEDGGYRLFNHGDAVFFTGSPRWGSVPGLSDGYIKRYIEG